MKTYIDFSFLMHQKRGLNKPRFLISMHAKDLTAALAIIVVFHDLISSLDHDLRLIFAFSLALLGSITSRCSAK